MTTSHAATLVLVGGHESDGGLRLRPWVEDGLAFRAVDAGQDLVRAVEEALALSDLPVCVVPMTLGRDPRLVADAARALAWSARPTRSTAAGRIALTEPFGSAEHLVGWLRAAGADHAGAAPDRSEGTALLVTAPMAGPFEDAELFRIARLVRQHGRYPWVEVAFDGGDPEPGEGVERCRRLGARRVVLLNAAFGTRTAGVVPGAEDGGPLLSRHAVAGVLGLRLRRALLRLRAGADGIAEGLGAEHGHGYAHSHGPNEADHAPVHPHQHPHAHPHAQPHQHPHSHPHGSSPAASPAVAHA